MASTRRKSAAIALAVIGIAGLSLASAAQLNIGSGALGAANTVVAACQDSAAVPIEIGFTSAYDAAIPGYATSAVTLDDVVAACVGQDIEVTVADAAGVSLASGSGVAAAGLNTITLDADVDAELIELVAVVISG